MPKPLALLAVPLLLLAGCATPAEDDGLIHVVASTDGGPTITAVRWAVLAIAGIANLTPDTHRESTQHGRFDF